MILDAICNADLYAGISENLGKALRFLKTTDFSAAEPGTQYEIDGKAVYAFVTETETNPPEKSIWETHKTYGDIHFILEGAEIFGHALKTADSDTWPYTENGDYLTKDMEGSFATLLPGTFAVVFAGEPHMPVVTAPQSKRVKKVILKFLL